MFQLKRVFALAGVMVLLLVSAGAGVTGGMAHDNPVEGETIVLVNEDGRLFVLFNIEYNLTNPTERAKFEKLNKSVVATEEELKRWKSENFVPAVRSIDRPNGPDPNVTASVISVERESNTTGVVSYQFVVAHLGVVSDDGNSVTVGRPFNDSSVVLTDTLRILPASEQDLVVTNLTGGQPTAGGVGYDTAEYVGDNTVEGFESVTFTNESAVTPTPTETATPTPTQTTTAPQTNNGEGKQTETSATQATGSTESPSEATGTTQPTQADGDSPFAVALIAVVALGATALMARREE